MSICRAIRGAITIKNDTKSAIASATKMLLKNMVSGNKISKEEIVSVIFTVTRDIKSDFPANAARQMGWQFVPMICANEIPVPSGIKKCIRVLMTVNSNKQQKAIKHVYLEGAASLRPDLK